MAYSPFKKELNRQFLSGAIRHPEILAECHLTEKDFDSDVNRVVFSALKACIAQGGKFSEYVLIDRMVSMGQKLGGMLDPAIYVTKLLGLAVNQDAALSIAKEIGKTSVRRELYEAAQRVQQAIEEDAGAKKSLNAIELISKTTGIFNEKVNLLGSRAEDEPMDLYEDLEEYIESLGHHPEDIGPIPPFPIYHDLWGTFSPGDMSVYCARPKGAKSTFLMNIVEQCVLKDPEVVCLMLDTELETKRVQRRITSAMTDVNEYIIRTGKWKENPTIALKVREALQRSHEMTARINHTYVGGKTTEEQLSICRRWFHKHAAMGKKALICLDYIKLGSVDLDNLGVMKDYQSVGKKVDQFKQLATELQCHVLTAAQTNRSNEGRDINTRRSDGAAIGLSDFISQYASNIYILEKLTLEQIAMFSSLDCTHTLSCVYARNLGVKGSEPLVRYQDARGKDRWTENFVFYRIKNFRVEELTDFRTEVGKNRTIQIPVQPLGREREGLL